MNPSDKNRTNHGIARRSGGHRGLEKSIIWIPISNTGGKKPLSWLVVRAIHWLEDLEYNSSRTRSTSSNLYIVRSLKYFTINTWRLTPQIHHSQIADRCHWYCSVDSCSVDSWQHSLWSIGSKSVRPLPEPCRIFYADSSLYLVKSAKYILRPRNRSLKHPRRHTLPGHLDCAFAKRITRLEVPFSVWYYLHKTMSKILNSLEHKIYLAEILCLQNPCLRCFKAFL